MVLLDQDGFTGPRDDDEGSCDQGNSPEPGLAGFQELVRAARDTRQKLEPAIALTAAQVEILRLLETDATVAEIARRDPARRSAATIRAHVQHVYEALGVHSRAAAVVKAKELALF